MSYSIAFGEFDKAPEYYHLPEDSELLTAVKLSMRLGKPLLLSGEPGTGKTQLAHYIAWYLNKLSNTTDDFPIPFLPIPFVYNAKTTSVAKDMFYEYDTLSHFHDKSGEKSPSTFVYLKALGLSIMQTCGKDEIFRELPNLSSVRNIELLSTPQQSSVVLIDEIDKAPRDFPNDLLMELENYEFDINEINTTIKRSFDRNARILVIITTNNEKNLPEAFLRRCIFHHISYFEDRDTLLDILLKRLRPFLSEQKISYDEQILTENYKQAINFFLKSRSIALQKKPSTSELLDWIKVLHLDRPLSEKWNLDELTNKEKELLSITLGVLFKNQKDIELFKKQNSLF